MKASIYRVLSFLGILIFATCVFAMPAFAHAQLDATSPEASSVLKSSPKIIEVSFSETVDQSFGSLRLFDSTGERITTSKPKKVDEKTIAVSPPNLNDGIYLVAWSAVSADSHPIRGAFTFSVGNGNVDQSGNADTFTQIIAKSDGSTAVKNGFTVLRFLSFLSLAIVIGILVLRLFVVQQWSKSNIDFIFVVSLIVLGISSLLSIGFQAAISGGFSLPKAFSLEVLDQERTTRFGIVEIFRTLLCVFTFFAWKARRVKLRKTLLALALIVLSITPTLSGHASTGKYVVLAFTADAFHVLAASAWLGGLLVLPILLSRKDGLQISLRFSKLALISVVTIAITGLFAWWRQVGSIVATRETWFGQLINIKVILLLATIFIAWFSRKQVRSLLKGDKGGSKQKLMKLVYLESILLIFVMVATSIVVSAVPARDAIALPVTKQLSAETSTMEIVIDPAKAGPVDIHMYVLQKNGLPYVFDESVNTLSKPAVTATLFNEKHDIGPLPIAIRFLGGNHFISAGTSIPFSGDWTVEIKMRIDEFDEESFTTNIKVR